MRKTLLFLLVVGLFAPIFVATTTPEICTKNNLANINRVVCPITNFNIFELYSPRAARDPALHADLGAKEQQHTVKSTFGLRILKELKNRHPDTPITLQMLEQAFRDRDSFSLTESEQAEFEKEWKRIVSQYENKYDSIEISQRGHNVDAGSDPHDDARQITAYTHPKAGANADKKAVLDFENQHINLSGIETKSAGFKIHAEKVKGLTMKNSKLVAPQLNMGHVEGNIDLEGSEFTVSSFGAKPAIFQPYSEYKKYGRRPTEIATVINGSVNAKNVTAESLQIGNSDKKVLFPYNANKVDFSDAILPKAKFRFEFDSRGYGTHKGKYLKKFNFNRANLTSADMREQHFYDQAQFESAILHSAKLQEAIVEEANFKKANLQHANLTQIMAELANFTKADLKNANLQSANLKKAILDGADLKNANLQDADLRGASLKGTDLRGVKNLASAKLEGATIKDAIVTPAQYLILKDKGFQDGCCKVRGNCTYRQRVLHIQTKGDSQCGNYCLAVIVCETPRIPPVTFTVFCEAERDGNCPVDPNACAENEPEHKAFVQRESELWGDSYVIPSETGVEESEGATPGTGGVTR